MLRWLFNLILKFFSSLFRLGYKKKPQQPHNSNYRNTFIKAYPGVRLPGRPGYWYRCSFCGKWCGRPGNTGAKIPDAMKMEVDHIRPWSQGGSDELFNLQPACKPCNRAKSNNATVRDSMTNMGNAVFHPVDTFIKAPLRKAVRQNKILKALGLNKRG